MVGIDYSHKHSHKALDSEPETQRSEQTIEERYRGIAKRKQRKTRRLAYRISKAIYETGTGGAHSMWPLYCELNSLHKDFVIPSKLTLQRSVSVIENTDGTYDLTLRCLVRRLASAKDAFAPFDFRLRQKIMQEDLGGVLKPIIQGIFYHGLNYWKVINRKRSPFSYYYAGFGTWNAANALRGLIDTRHFNIKSYEQRLVNRVRKVEIYIYAARRYGVDSFANTLPSVNAIPRFRIIATKQNMAKVNWQVPLPKISNHALMSSVSVEILSGPSIRVSKAIEGGKLLTYHA